MITKFWIKNWENKSLSQNIIKSERYDVSQKGKKQERINKKKSCFDYKMCLVDDLYQYLYLPVEKSILKNTF